MSILSPHCSRNKTTQGLPHRIILQVVVQVAFEQNRCPVHLASPYIGYYKNMPSASPSPSLTKTVEAFSQDMIQIGVKVWAW